MQSKALNDTNTLINTENEEKTESTTKITQEDIEKQEETFGINSFIQNSKQYTGDFFENTLFYYPVEDSFIDVLLQKDNTVYPVAIHKNKLLPKDLITEFNHIKGEKNSKLKRGLGVVLCLTEQKTYLKDNIVALPISYL